MSSLQGSIYTHPWSDPDHLMVLLSGLRSVSFCRCLNANPIPSIPPAVLPRKGAKENATARGPCFIYGVPENNYPLTGSPRIIYAPPGTAGEVRYHTIFIKKNGDVAQLGERGVRNAEARGSIPLISTKT
jgi:hypothetical protein